MMPKIPYKIKRIVKIPYNIYLCLRFPFLYPRNRFTGRHYNNWWIRDKIQEIRKKYPNPKTLYNDELLIKMFLNHIKFI